MDWQSAFNILFGVATGLGIWILRTLWEATQTLARDMKALESKLPETYARRDDLKEIREALIRIEGKLDGKADR